MRSQRLVAPRLNEAARSARHTHAMETETRCLAASSSACEIQERLYAQRRPRDAGSARDNHSHGVTRRRSARGGGVVTRTGPPSIQPPNSRRSSSGNRADTGNPCQLVDASQCQTLLGRFGIVYTMENENAPDYEFREELMWLPGSMKVSKEFSIDEAGAAYRTDNIAPCPCRK